MLEKELALKLSKKALELELNNSQSMCPKSLFAEINKCDFELLQNECNKLNFHICKTNETTFNKRFYKSIFNKGDIYIIYTNKSINNINYY